MSGEKVRRALENKMKGIIPIQCFVATVSSVDEDKHTCDVVRVEDDAEIPNVRLKSTIDDKKDGVISIPTKDSFVIVGKLGNRTNSCFVISFSNIDKYLISTEKGMLEIKDDGTMLLNGDDYNGLVMIQELKDNLNAIKDYLSAEKNAIASGFSAVGVGTAANGTNGANAFNSAMASEVINFSDMENKDVKHGKKK